ncbi:MAG: hypothetical protein ABR955_01005, partial [Verrucomicrobiota bacterium]
MPEFIKIRLECEMALISAVKLCLTQFNTRRLCIETIRLILSLISPMFAAMMFVAIKLNYFYEF